MKKIEQIKQQFLAANKNYDSTVENGLCNAFHLLPVQQFDAYPETPRDAVVFAITGLDGLHYCMLEENDTVGIYLIIPNQTPCYYKLAGSMDEFLSYTISIYGMFELALTCDEVTFLQIIADMEFDQLAKLGSKQCHDDMLAWQSDFKIQYTDPQRVFQLLKAYQVHK